MVLRDNWLKMWGRSLLLSYIDAGTGSLVIQILIGSFAGILLALKMSWNKLKNWIKPNRTVRESVEVNQEHPVVR